MFILQIWVRGVANPFGLRFKSAEAAEKVCGELCDTALPEMMELTDDYGTKLVFGASDLGPFVLIPIAGDIEAQIDQQIFGAKEQAKGQTRANADKGLTFLQNVANGRLGLAVPS